ncbi:type II toxin-antitoxin system RelE family toxin [Thermoplasma acidophilum]|uniref:type II toxin-antitoxin system RelE family toxin n=1 Tax=Thermoplasma acidophilum TaxID=2303 RepID=UPI00064F5527|nr:type II toxin-antitoxin system RelE/ParE family toxin [Thermoplasma acidophilum]MCY0851447.1 type II toxin-antitoxin system RelE/ParE family toxin [Thermoplasma acidophilum]
MEDNAFKEKWTVFMNYIVESTETFEREFFKNHKDKKEWLQHMIERLEQEPQSGKPLRGKLHGLWQLRIGPFRVWYEINERERKVILRAILHKDEAKKYY